MEKVEDISLEFASIVDATIAGVSDVDLALKVGEAHNLLKQLQESYDSWIEAVRVECLKQDAERQKKLASVGLTGLPTAKPAGAKRGRKPKADKDAQANAENEALALEEDEVAGGNEALLDAE